MRVSHIYAQLLRPPPPPHAAINAWARATNLCSRFPPLNFKPYLWFELLPLLSLASPSPLSRPSANTPALTSTFFFFFLQRIVCLIFAKSNQPPKCKIGKSSSFLRAAAYFSSLLKEGWARRRAGVKFAWPETSKEKGDIKRMDNTQRLPTQLRVYSGSNPFGSVLWRRKHCDQPIYYTKNRRKDNFQNLNRMRQPRASKAACHGKNNTVKFKISTAEG